MPPLPPIPPPTDAIENLGPDKVDLDRAPDDTHYLKASEWNWVKRYTKWLYDAYISLTLTGSTGTLWDAYQNHGLGTNLNPARVYLDFNIGSVIFTDDAAPLGKLLLGVSDNAGGGEYGLWAHGLRLRDSVDAIHTAGNVAIRMRSTRTAAAGAAYKLDTTNPYTVSQSLYELTNGSNPLMSITGGGSLSFFHILDSSLLWSLQPAYSGTGNVRLVSAQPGGGGLLPQAPGVGTLGIAAEPWRGIHARFHATSRNTSAYAAFKTYDLNTGEWQEVTLTGDMSIVGISNAQIGAEMALMFIQGGIGGYVLGLPIDILTHRPFRLSQSVGDVDVLHIRFDGLAWYEVGRWQSNAPDDGFVGRTITGGDILLQAHRDAHTQEFQGTLTAAQTIQVDPAFFVANDKFEVIFDDLAGVTTTVANTLTLKIFGGATLAVFNQNKTLRGRLLLYHTGSTWKTAGLAALSYT